MNTGHHAEAAMSDRWQRRIKDALTTMKRYQEERATVTERIKEDEQWYRLRHWDAIRRKGEGRTAKEEQRQSRPEPTSAWLFNSLMNKHADAMDNYPEPNVLPREQRDEQDAVTLSQILPVILEQNDFADTYNYAWWEKLKHGTAVYGVFWDSSKQNGLGDIAIKPIDLLNIYWEGGIQNIQDSRNLFIVDAVDNDLLQERYPALEGKLTGGALEKPEYIHDDTVDMTKKTLVVDWYYKVGSPGGRTVLHYAKIASETLLYTTEDDPATAERGLYDHGLYPVVFDIMYPIKGSPAGFGLVTVTKDPQLYIDALSQNVLENARMASKVRYMGSKQIGLNVADFMDWSKDYIEFDGNVVDREQLRAVEVPTLPGYVVNIMQMKIDELKETSANRDFSQGGTGAGVTAASAIAALQEAGNKSSRDIIAAAYRSYTKVCYLAVELIRQFYDEQRSFRITGPDGTNGYVTYSNESIKDPLAALPQGMEPPGGLETRKPVFDMVIKAQRRDPFSRMSQNELAKELYGMGFFNPELAQQALGALELMEFEGKEKVREHVSQGQTLQNMLTQLTQQYLAVQQVLEQRGVPIAPPITLMQGGGALAAPAQAGGRTRNGERLDAASATRTGYMEQLAARSVPDMNGEGGGAL